MWFFLLKIRVATPDRSGFLGSAAAMSQLFPVDVLSLVSEIPWFLELSSSDISVEMLAPDSSSVSVNWVERKLHDFPR